MICLRHSLSHWSVVGKTLDIHLWGNRKSPSEFQHQTKNTTALESQPITSKKGQNNKANGSRQISSFNFSGTIQFPDPGGWTSRWRCWMFFFSIVEILEIGSHFTSQWIGFWFTGWLDSWMAGWPWLVGYEKYVWSMSYFLQYLLDYLLHFHWRLFPSSSISCLASEFPIEWCSEFHCLLETSLLQL